MISAMSSIDSAPNFTRVLRKPDADVRTWAHADGAILVTCNRDDFLELRPEGEHPGIVILIRRNATVADRLGLAKPLQQYLRGELQRKESRRSDSVDATDANTPTSAESSAEGSGNSNIP